MSAPGPIRVIQTARNTGDRLAEKAPLQFGSAGDQDVPRIEVDRGARCQRIEGFGGAFTEAGAHTLSKMSPEKRQEVLRAYFDVRTGSNYSLCRTHINSCDFSLGSYSYDDVGGDYELRHFDIAHDRELLIPFIKDALALRRDLRILASPWSPPAWMKTSGEMGGGGTLRRDCLEPWAHYLARYVHAYADEGISIWAVTVQNEPPGTPPWESCVYTAEEERDFVKYYLKPRLQADGLARVKVLGWDNRKAEIEEQANMLLSDPVAAEAFWGVAFHGYGEDHFDQLDRVHQRFPDKKLLATELCVKGAPQLGAWHNGEQYGHAIIGALNHWSTGWIDWNMVLDERGGPNHAGNFCDAPIIADTRDDTLHFQSSYYYVGHISRYVQHGAERIKVRCSSRDLEVTGFINLDGSIAVIIMNRGDEGLPLQLVDGRHGVETGIPEHAIITLVYA